MGAYQPWMLPQDTRDSHRDVDLVLILAKGRGCKVLTNLEDVHNLLRSHKCVILSVEVTTTTIGNLPARVAAKLADMESTLKEVRRTLSQTPVFPCVMAVTTSGVMAVETTDGLEKFGLSRSEISSLYTKCMRNTLGDVKTMKSAYFDGFKGDNDPFSL